MDPEIRALERLVAESGGLGERLRLAEALRKVGAFRRACDALSPAIATAEARAFLASLPAWAHNTADAGSSRHVNVEPLRSQPRILWRHQQEVPGAGSLPPILLCSPLGVVTCGRTHDRAQVLESSTGAVRY